MSSTNSLRRRRQRSQRRRQINKEERNNKPISIKNNESTPLLSELLWLSSLALPSTIATIGSGPISSSSLSTRTKTIFVICGFVPKVGVVFDIGGCLWVCFWVLEVVLDLVFVGLFLICSGEMVFVRS